MLERVSASVERFAGRDAGTANRLRLNRPAPYARSRGTNLLRRNLRMERRIMLAGSCLCGSVRYEVDAPIGPIIHCHCATCRKAHGAAFSSLSAVPRDRFRWVAGADLLGSFESSSGKFRRFCSKCGSQLIADRLAQPMVMLRLGCLDTIVTARPKAHIWRSDAAPWFDPRDVLPERPRGFAD